MSVKELVISDLNNMTKMYVRIIDGRFKFEIDSDADGDWLWLDRNQAHLLMLYLQEHLKEDISKELWRCSCGRWHPKDFVCERIGK
jgi:hypothetical protein